MTIAEERVVLQKAGEVVRSVVERFSPDVVRARFQMEEDWEGDPVLYVRVTLRDAAIRGKRLHVVAESVRAYVRSELRITELERTPSVRFRGESETVEMPDPKWM